MVRGIADTGFLVAFANRRDQYFPWAYRLAERVHEPLLTCEAVLAEAAHHLNSSALVFRMLEANLIKVAFDFDAHWMDMGVLASRYDDRRPDLADICLIKLSELHPQLPVITIDSDFHIYRRNRTEMIPLLPPFDGDNTRSS